MNPTLISTLLFGGLFGSALLGLRLQRLLPEHHLSKETKEAVGIGMGSVATMAALVLGLLVAFTTGAWETKKTEVMGIAAKVVYLDQLLANYGPETAESREVLRGALRNAIVRIWPAARVAAGTAAPASAWSETLPKAIQKLSPRDSAQHTFKKQAARLANELGQMRWLLFERTESSISGPFLVLMAFWLALTFISGGLFAPANATVIIAQLMAALAVSGAVFLILELDRPFRGFIQISSEPMLNALIQIGK